jgi:hypothetical protein
MPLTRADIESFAEMLRSMPPPPPAAVNVTKQEAVKLLAGEIASVQRRGYTLAQIADALKGVGLDLTTPTLKNYLGRAKVRKPRREPSRKPPSPLPTARESTRKEAAPGAPRDTPAKSGKDAFLVKDKDSY